MRRQCGRGDGGEEGRGGGEGGGVREEAKEGKSTSASPPLPAPPALQPIGGCPKTLRARVHSCVFPLPPPAAAATAAAASPCSQHAALPRDTQEREGRTGASDEAVSLATHVNRLAGHNAHPGVGHHGAGDGARGRARHGGALEGGAAGAERRGEACSTAHTTTISVESLWP